MRCAEFWHPQSNSTIRARCASPARTELDRVNASSRERPPSRSTSGAATEMRRCPALPTANHLTTRNTSLAGPVIVATLTGTAPVATCPVSAVVDRGGTRSLAT
jgi:hypothetical protein